MRGLSPGQVYQEFAHRNGCTIYVDIMTGENYLQFNLITWNSFIDPIRWGKTGGIVILAHCLLPFIKEHGILVLDTNNNISILSYKVFHPK